MMPMMLSASPLSASPAPEPAPSRPGGGKEKAAAAACLARRRRDTVVRCVAAALGVPMRDIRGARRGTARQVEARQIGIYLLHVVFSVPLNVTGPLFGKDRTTAAHACQRIEERRDDAAFDAFMHDLELAVSALDSAVSYRTNSELKEAGAW